MSETISVVLKFISSPVGGFFLGALIAALIAAAIMGAMTDGVIDKLHPEWPVVEAFWHGEFPMNGLVLQDIETDRALGLLGFFVTEEDPVLSRRLDAGGYALLVHLPQAPTLQTLERLAACKNRGRLIEQALAVQPARHD